MAPFRTEIYGNFRIADLLILKLYYLKLNRADTVYYKYKARHVTKYLYLINLQIDPFR